MAPVRAHKKSRKGCRTCKRRKVKCDETSYPRCANCVKRDIECDWPESCIPETPSSSDSSEQPSPSTSNAQDESVLRPAAADRGTPTETCVAGNASSSTIVREPFYHPFDMSSMELLHHYTTDTYLSLVEAAEFESFPIMNIFQSVVPKLALAEPYLMHALLSLAALHLHCLHRTLHSTKSKQYLTLSEYHRQQAQARLLEDACHFARGDPSSQPISQDQQQQDHVCPLGCDPSAQFMCNLLLSINAFCLISVRHADQRSNRVPLLLDWFNEQKRMISTFFGAHKAQIEAGPLSPMWHSRGPHGGHYFRTQTFQQLFKGSLTDAANSRHPNLPSQLSTIHMPFSGAPDDDELLWPDASFGGSLVAPVYQEAVDLLFVTHRIFYSVGSRLRAMMTWPSALSQTFIRFLCEEKRPRALFIFAHYCLLYRTCCIDALPGGLGGIWTKKMWWAGHTPTPSSQSVAERGAVGSEDDILDSIKRLMVNPRWVQYLDDSLARPEGPLQTADSSRNTHIVPFSGLHGSSMAPGSGIITVSEWDMAPIPPLMDQLQPMFGMAHPAATGVQPG